MFFATFYCTTLPPEFPLCDVIASELSVILLCFTKFGNIIGIYPELMRF